MQDNLGGVTERQAFADSVCYQTVNKYAKDRSNEHMDWRKYFHGHYSIFI
jgi:putative lipoic acid-binding regulatory protein